MNETKGGDITALRLYGIRLQNRVKRNITWK